MRKVDANVKELVNMVERGELRLPKCSGDTLGGRRVHDLLNSLYRGHPIGLDGGSH